jgi:Ser/Thr protein kinase RdoA (MazF antagonist)
VIDFDDCGWGYYLLDLASVLDSFARRVITSPKEYPQIWEAYLRGYDSIRPLPADLDLHLRTGKVMRDLVNVNFILSSKNASVQTWGRQRLRQIIAHLQASLKRSAAIGI